MSTRIVTNEQLYQQVIEPVARAKSFVWMGTAGLKDLHVHHHGGVRSFLSVLQELVKRKVNCTTKLKMLPCTSRKKP